MEFEADLLRDDAADLDLRLTFSVPEDETLTMAQAGLTTLRGSLRIERSETGEEARLLVESEPRGSVGPPLYTIPEPSMTTDVTVTLPQVEPTTIRVIYVVDGEIRDQWETVTPRYEALQFADAVTHRSVRDFDIQWIRETYEFSDITTAAFEFLEELSPWIQLEDHLRIQNAIARESEEFRDRVTAKGFTYFLSRQITSADGSNSYEIDSMEALDQITSLCKYLEHLPSINAYKILETTLRLIHQNESFDELWRIEQRFHLGRNYWGSLLWENQMAAVLAKSIVENEFRRARQMVEHWVGGRPLGEEELQAAIDDTKAVDIDEAHHAWRDLMGRAREAPDRDFTFVVLQYLYTYQRNTSPPFYLQRPIYKAIEISAESLGIEGLAKHARDQKHLTKGQFFRRHDRFDEALEAFDQALESALEDDVGTMDTKIAPEWPLYWRKATEADFLAENGDLETGITVLEEGIELLDALESTTDESTREHCRTRLEARHFEFRGDQSLEQDRLEEALRHYGMAINSYQEADREDESSYLVQRRGLIKASLAEQEGDFVRAKNTHEGIAQGTDDQSFEYFNRKRAQVCRSKELVLDREFEQARENLESVLSERSFSSVEAKYLMSLIELLETYEEGGIVNIRNTLDGLEELPDLAEVTEEYPFEYGHDYRPAFVNILAAQRLRMAGVDPTLLDDLVDISIRHVLAPARADQAIEEWQMEEIGLHERWKLHFPTHIVNRFQEIEADKITNRGNFADQTLAQLKLVEQALEFVASYYGPRYFGEDWREQVTDRDDGRLSLGDLRNFLNTGATAECVWNDRLKNAIDTELIGADDLIDARNMLGHDRKAQVTVEEYHETRERIVEIFSLLDSELPVLAEIETRHELGSNIMDLKWENPQKWCYLNFDGDLDEDTLYYLPAGALNESIVVHSMESEVVECRSDRVLDNIAAFDAPPTSP